jgi:hypothetical protein
VDGDTVRANIIRLSTKAAREQGADLWVEVVEEKRSRVERIVAQAPFIEADPAAAELAVIDPDGHLLGRMAGDKPYNILVGGPEQLSLDSPTIWMEIEQALEQFRVKRGLATLAQAAKESAVKWVIDAGPAITEENGTQVARVTLLSDKNWNAEAVATEAAAAVQQVFSEVKVEHDKFADEAKGVYYVHVDFLGPQAAEAAKTLLANPDVARLAQEAADQRVDQLFATLGSFNKGVSGKGAAAQPKREWFTVAVNQPAQVDSAIGSTAWLKTVPEVPEIKVALDAPSDQGKTRSGASAVVAAVVGKKDPDLLQRLNATFSDGNFEMPQLDHTKEGAAVAVQYRTTIQETVSGV